MADSPDTMTPVEQGQYPRCQIDPACTLPYGHKGDCSDAPVPAEQGQERWPNGEPRGERAFVCYGCGNATVGDYPQAFCKNVAAHNGEQPRMEPVVPVADKRALEQELARSEQRRKDANLGSQRNLEVVLRAKEAAEGRVRVLVEAGNELASWLKLSGGDPSGNREAALAKWQGAVSGDVQEGER